MERREPEASFGKICHWMDDYGRPVILKFVVCKDIIWLPSGRVTAVLKISGCM